MLVADLEIAQPTKIAPGECVGTLASLKRCQFVRIGAARGTSHDFAFGVPAGVFCAQPCGRRFWQGVAFVAEHAHLLAQLAQFLAFDGGQA